MLISRLDKRDIPTILNYLNGFNTTFSEEKKMSTSHLLKYLLENPTASQELVIEYFEIKKHNTFEKQVERLKEKIGYCLTSEIITQRGDLSKVSSSFHLALYKWSRANAYLGGKLNLPEEAYNELSKIVQLCKTYEHYSPLVEALYLQRNFLMLRQGTKRFEEKTKEIKHYERCRDAYHRARQWHNEYMQYMDYDGYRSGSIRMLEKAIEELKVDYTETNSVTIGYFYFIIKKGYYQETRNFPFATEYALKLINIVDNKAIYMPRRLGTAYAHLAETYLCQKKFDQCFEAIRTAQNYFKPNTLNYATTEELEFWAMFYLGEYEKAEAKIVGIISNREYKQSPIIDNKRYYLYACTLFALGKIKECISVLESVKEIHTDKRGWNIGIRVMTLMALLYSDDQEEVVFYKLGSLYMHLRALKELKETRKRDVIIFNILTQLIKNNCDFALVYGKMKDEFKLLERRNPDYGWQILGHELIIFQEWFKSRLEGTPYNVNLGAQKHQLLAII